MQNTSVASTLQLEKALVGGAISARRHNDALPPAAYLPLQPVARYELTNTLTNKPTNKHDGSQYLLAEVIKNVTADIRQ